MQEFNSDVTIYGDVDAGDISAGSAAFTGTVQAASVSGNTATFTGAVEAAYLSGTGTAARQAMSQNAVTAAINALRSELINNIYPIGSLFISTSGTSPAASLGGTWERISSDAYLKIVTSNAGATGGTASNHVIPLDSMPAHTHEINRMRAKGSTGVSEGNVEYLYRSTNMNDNVNVKSTVAGGSLPYYPYYYGVYVWKRTA